MLPTKIEPAPLLQKTRKLPAWLIQASNVDVKSTENNARARKGRAGAANAGKKVKPSTPGKYSVLVLSYLFQLNQQRFKFSTKKSLPICF